MQIPKPDYFLGIGGKTHGAMTGQMIEKIEKVLIKERPDWVLVYGDTNSTLAGAIAASKLHIKVAHIESGLRSFNMKMPEEVNRILTDRVSSLLFCPSQLSVDNLAAEGIDQFKDSVKIVLSGDVMQDGAIFYKNFAQKPTNIDILDDFILCTIHRAENTDDTSKLDEIVSTLNEIAIKRQVILPLHPRTRAILQQGQFNTSNLTIIDPVGYLNMVWLIDNCSLVMTDSGGLQKEAFFFKKPCVVMRNETEWTELIEHGYNYMVGSSYSEIMSVYLAENYNTNYSLDLYGSGNASKVIVESLIQ